MVMNDKIGRKHSIMISVIPSTAGFLMMAAAHQVWLLLLGRLLTGFAGGITASSIPVGTFPGIMNQITCVCMCVSVFVCGVSSHSVLHKS